MIKYYIFGSNDNVKYLIKMNKKKCVFESEDLTDILNKYQLLIDERRYHNMWLIADFGIYKPGALFSTGINTVDDYLPFFIIGEYHISDLYDRENVIRDDLCVISYNGFNHQIKNNLSALQEFIYHLSKCNAASLYIKYATNNKDGEVYHNKLVGSVEKILNNGGKVFRVKNFILNSNKDWIGMDINRVKINMDVYNSINFDQEMPEAPEVEVNEEEITYGVVNS